MTTPARISHSARKEILKPHPITGYLAGAVGTAALLSATSADAAVTAVTFGFGSVRDASDGIVGNFSVGPGFGTIFSYWQTSGPFSGAMLVSYQDGPGIGRVVFLNDGTVIGNGLNGSFGTAYFSHQQNPARRFGADQLNKNIGFKTSTNNWGWANVNWIEATKSLQINSAYVESVPNATITVGDVGAVPEPSRALLALAGLAGVALRRRRKQAA